MDHGKLSGVLNPDFNQDIIIYNIAIIFKAHSIEVITIAE